MVVLKATLNSHQPFVRKFGHPWRINRHNLLLIYITKKDDLQVLQNIFHPNKSKFYINRLFYVFTLYSEWEILCKGARIAVKPGSCCRDEPYQCGAPFLPPDGSVALDQRGEMGKVIALLLQLWKKAGVQHGTCFFTSRPSRLRVTGYLAVVTFDFLIAKDLFQRSTSRRPQVKSWWRGTLFITRLG